MKKLEELGISPAPWFSGQTANGIGVYDAEEFALTDSEDGFSSPDARMLAAAPKLYDAGERLLRFHDESCVHGSRTFAEITRDYQKAWLDLRSALAEAAGESEADDGK